MPAVVMLTTPNEKFVPRYSTAKFCPTVNTYSTIDVEMYASFLEPGSGCHIRAARHILPVR
eukprot:scaffold43462_cov47-Prasinocladus_malaysianus.AAC.1